MFYILDNLIAGIHSYYVSMYGIITQVNFKLPLSIFLDEELLSFALIY